MAEYQIKKIKKSECAAAAWSGGTTTEFLIMPEGSVYGERNFLWRLSSATVDLDESTFTALPDYDRIIMTLEGGMDLSHNGGEWIHLKEFMPHEFDGGDVTVSRGRVTDFNLMLRKGICTGRMILVIAHSKETGALPDGENPKTDGKAADYILYCHQGVLTLTVGASEEALEGGQALYISGIPDGVKIRYMAETDVRAVLVSVTEFPAL